MKTSQKSALNGSALEKTALAMRDTGNAASAAVMWLSAGAAYGAAKEEDRADAAYANAQKTGRRCGLLRVVSEAILARIALGVASDGADWGDDLVWVLGEEGEDVAGHRCQLLYALGSRHAQKGDHDAAADVFGSAAVNALQRGLPAMVEAARFAQARSLIASSARLHGSASLLLTIAAPLVA